MGGGKNIYGKGDWHKLLHRNVTVLGEALSCTIHIPDDKDSRNDRFQGFTPQVGTLLCSAADGRSMFMLRPLRDLGPRKHGKSAVKAFNLHERFTHRSADDYFNVEVADFRKPVFRGELTIIRYLADKDIDDETQGEIIWEHYFEDPGNQPAYAELWDVGMGQFYIPPGPYEINEDGICYSKPTGAVRNYEYGS